LRDLPPVGVVIHVGQNNQRIEKMNLLKHTARLLAVTTLAFTALVGAAQDKKMDEPALMQPVKSVYDSYLKIQAELSKDSLKGVDENASAIAKAVRGDEMKMLSPEVAKQAEALAKAKDVKAAREAFKPLSASLVKYLADHKAGKGTYHEAYCPMAKASWLQTSKDITNPYMGKSMLNCGVLKN
jgi:hypothetical protein